MKHRIAAALLLCSTGLLLCQLATHAQDAKDASQSGRPDHIAAASRDNVFSLADLPIIGSLFTTGQSNGDGSASTLVTAPIYTADGDGNTVLNWFAGPTASDVRVSPDVNNQNIRDAIKHVIGKANVTFEIDDDVPADTKVSLKAANITLTTAINALIEAAGIGCKETVKSAVSDTNGKRTVTSQIQYHFTKKPTPPLGRGRFPWAVTNQGLYKFDPNTWNFNGNLPANIFKWNSDGSWMIAPKANRRGSNNDPTKKPNSNDNKDGAKPETKSGTNANDLSNLLVTPQADVNYNAAVRNALKSYNSLGSGNRSLIYNLSTSESRSTFTCPNCKQQVTIIKKHVAPKCPTCGRVFQDDWKFCPADGAKRPEEAGDWKFCPHCGKPVP